MNPSPCLTAGSNQNVVTPAGWSGEMLQRMRNREERRSDTPFSSLQHFKKVGFGDVQVGDDCGAYCYAFPVFKPDFSNSKAW